MLSPIKTVAVLGASGNIGQYIVRALVDAGFTVTAVRRADSSATTVFPPSVIIRTADYSSIASLTEALRGQDAAVSAIGMMGLALQKAIIDAAVAAGVRRFVPSEFGTPLDSISPNMRALMGAKVDALAHLKAKASELEEGTFTWTSIATSVFLEFCLDHPVIFGIDIPARKATIFDSGNEKISVSSMAQVGRAVAAALKNADETANRYLRVYSAHTNQRELLGVIEEELGDGGKFAVTKVSTVDMEKRGHEKFAKGDFTAFFDLLAVHNYRDGADNWIKPGESANSMLGLGEEDLRALVREKFARGYQYGHH